MPLEAVVGTAGNCAPQGTSLGTLRCNSLRVLHPTRLETRNKESDMRASLRVLKPGKRKEADEREGSSVKGSSWSTPVGTRNMVNYA